jgi:hypothetical protein
MNRVIRLHNWAVGSLLGTGGGHVLRRHWELLE